MNKIITGNHGVGKTFRLFRDLPKTSSIIYSSIRYKELFDKRNDCLNDLGYSPLEIAIIGDKRKSKGNQQYITLDWNDLETTDISNVRLFFIVQANMLNMKYTKLLNLKKIDEIVIDEYHEEMWFIRNTAWNGCDGFFDHKKIRSKYSDKDFMKLYDANGEGKIYKTFLTEFLEDAKKNKNVTLLSADSFAEWMFTNEPFNFKVENVSDSSINYKKTIINIHMESFVKAQFLDNMKGYKEFTDYLNKKYDHIICNKHKDENVDNHKGIIGSNTLIGKKLLVICNERPDRYFYGLMEIINDVKGNYSLDIKDLKGMIYIDEALQSLARTGGRRAGKGIEIDFLCSTHYYGFVEKLFEKCPYLIRQKNFLKDFDLTMILDNELSDKRISSEQEKLVILETFEYCEGNRISVKEINNILFDKLGKGKLSGRVLEIIKGTLPYRKEDTRYILNIKIK